MKNKDIPWELIIAKFKHEISKADNERLMQWATTPEHQALLNELNTLWINIQARSKNYNPDKEHYWKELSARMNKTKQQKETSAHKTIPLQRLYRYVVAACIVLVLSVCGSYYVGSDIQKKTSAEQVYTCMNGKSKVFLPDGTEVWLHDNTTLSYASDFKEDNRLVRISGEAYFDVTHNAHIPFIVQVDGIKIVVHGTKFNVNSRIEAEETRVSLIEGSVSLQTSSKDIFLQPGEIAIYNKELNHFDVNIGDVIFDKLWANNILHFSNKTLGEVCIALSKWYNVKIDVDNKLKDKFMYTFTLHNEPLEEIIRLMSRINPVTYNFSEDNVLTITMINE